MKFTDKLKDFKTRLSDRHMFSVVLAVVLIISGFAVYQYKRAVDYRYKLETQYYRSFNELVNFVDNIEINLAKGVVTTDSREMVKLANMVYSQSAFATATLGQLPITEVALENTSRFLAQVGDYTRGLSLRYLDGGQITDEEYDTLLNFNRYATTLSDSLLVMQSSLYSGTITFNELEKKGTMIFASQSNAFAGNLEDMESHFEDYPSLIYDGPYSDHIQNSSPQLLKDGAEITVEQARERALEAIGQERHGEITLLGETGGIIPSYSFSIVPSNTKDRNITIEITKINGMVSWMLDTRNVAATHISIDDAKAAGAAYLQNHAFPDMEDNYYEIDNNIVTINYASQEGDIAIYPDLAKVKIALDSGEVLGVECHGYIMNHYKRELPSFTAHSEAEIIQKISPKVSVSSINKCLIPLESNREVFCYEIKCSFDEKEFLIYLNQENLRQEDVLILVVSENGSLTI